MTKTWPALVIQAPSLDDPANAEELVAARLDDFAPQAIEDLVEAPLPPGGLWDPTFPPMPDPPPVPLLWRVYFATPASRNDAAAALRREWPSLLLTAVDIADEDWAARSQRSLSAVRAGRFVVAPPWDIPAVLPAGLLLIVIEPSRGFGTGHHPTTRLCLRLLSELDLSGRTVLDVGTGSGVLALAAALGGAAAVRGIDVDPDAIESARASAALNPLPQAVAFEEGDVRTAPPSRADLVIANLTGGMLCSAAEALQSLIHDGGTLIVSGFDESEEAAVREAFAPWPVGARLEEASWVALRFA